MEIKAKVQSPGGTKRKVSTVEILVDKLLLNQRKYHGTNTTSKGSERQDTHSELETSRSETEKQTPSCQIQQLVNAVLLDTDCHHSQASWPVYGSIRYCHSFEEA
jgi:hypothetical protein